MLVQAECVSDLNGFKVDDCPSGTITLDGESHSTGKMYSVSSHWHIVQRADSQELREWMELVVKMVEARPNEYQEFDSLRCICDRHR